MQKTKQKGIDYRDKIFKHRLQTFYRVLLVVILIAVVILFIKIRIDNQVYTKYEISETMDRVGTAESLFEDYQGNLLVHSKDGISAYDAKGQQLWNQTYEMQAPVVRTNGQYVAAGDYKGSTIYIMNGKGLTSTVETNMPILDLGISSQGVVIASLQEDDITWLKLYSTDGELITEMKTTMRKSGFPISFAISPDNIKVGVSYLKADGGKINTSLAFYNFGGVGQNETDNLVSGYDYAEQMIPLIIYPNDTNAVAVGDQNLLIITGKQKPTLDKEIPLEEEVQGVYYNAENFALVYRSEEADTEYEVHVYDMTGDRKLTCTVPFAYSDIIVEDNRIIIYNEARVMIVGLNEVIKYDGDLGGNIQALIPTESKTSFLAVFEDAVKLIKLR